MVVDNEWRAVLRASKLSLYLSLYLYLLLSYISVSASVLGGGWLASGVKAFPNPFISCLFPFPFALPISSHI